MQVSLHKVEGLSLRSLNEMQKYNKEQSFSLLV